jgi:hypothetical protein
MVARTKLIDSSPVLDLEAVMTEFTRRAVLGGLSALIATPAFAEAPWPARPIRLMIGFPAGGPIELFLGL